MADRTGTASDDLLTGSVESDSIRGLGGQDTISGLAGWDVLFGGPGDDSILGGPGFDGLWGGSGRDTLEGGSENDRLNGGSGDDRLLGGDGDDVLIGGAGNDAMQGGAGSDSLGGQDGNDSLNGGAGDDRLFGDQDSPFLGKPDALGRAQYRLGVSDFAILNGIHDRPALTAKSHGLVITDTAVSSSGAASEVSRSRSEVAAIQGTDGGPGNHTKLYGYLSVAKLAEFREYYLPGQVNYVLNQDSSGPNAVGFRVYFAKYDSPTWQVKLLERVADIARAGYTGIFLGRPAGA